MLVVTAVSSINTRWAGSRKPCSRIQRRRARATSARLRSAARRLFFDGDTMASEKSGQRAAAAWDTPLAKRRNDLIQREVRLLADEREDLPRVLLQWRSTPSTGHGFGSAVFTKALHPPERRTDADIKLFGRLPSGCSFFHKVDDARSQLTRIRSMHWPALRRINALDSHLRGVLGIPIHCGRDVLYLLIAQFPIDDIPERPALEIGAQILAEEIDGAMTVLITGRRDMRRDQYPGIGPEP